VTRPYDMNVLVTRFSSVSITSLSTPTGFSNIDKKESLTESIGAGLRNGNVSARPRDFSPIL
jgi:hypothetical protein